MLRASVLSALCVAAAMAAATPYSWRVTTGFGYRSRDHVRITMTDHVDDPISPATEAFFSYNAPFKYRWTKNRVHTTLARANLGGQTEYSVGDALHFNVTLPDRGQGIRGIMTADICYVSPIANCEVGLSDDILHRVPTLLNSAMSHDDVHFWSLLGDNFYDPDGTIAEPFYQALNDDVKSKIFYSLPGNYDFWLNGRPENTNYSYNQYGNGFMQYYGMDTQSSLANASQPFNFSNDPDDDSLRGAHHSIPNQQYLADVSNFQYYTQLGNVGFIAFSGAHPYHLIHPFITEACEWMQANGDTIDWIILMGHWARHDKGASKKSWTPGVYERLVQLPGCDGGNVRYFEGHHHCNMVDNTIAPAAGFIVAGFGKLNNHCDNFGIPIFDTTGGRLQVIYFPIAVDNVDNSTAAAHRYDQLQSCFATHGVSNCYHLQHDVWLNESAPERL